MITLLDIAERANVSRSTVSCVLNDRRNGVWIGEETRERVLRAAAELGYRRNDAARTMVTGVTRSLGFITAVPGSEHVARMLEGALDEADASGYDVQVIRPRNEANFDARLIERCVELRLAGVVVLYIEGPTLEHLHTEMTRFHIPLSLLDDNRHHTWGGPVVADYGQGMALAVQHLTERGHRRIALVVGEFSGMGAQARMEAFEAALVAPALPFALASLHRRPKTTEETVLSLRRWLQIPHDRPTALVTDTDATALMALRAARETGMRVPEDLSVIGFGDLTMAALSTPALTTVHQPFEAMGQAAVRRLLVEIKARREGSPQDAETPLSRPVLIPGRLVVRQSTGPAPD